jgi:hypothetical protein
MRLILLEAFFPKCCGSHNYIEDLYRVNGFRRSPLRPPQAGARPPNKAARQGRIRVENLKKSPETLIR